MNRRERALFLREARPYAAEVLDLYLALLDVWDEGATPDRVLKAVEASGPEPLAKALREMDFEAVLEKGTALDPAERFLLRACRRFDKGTPGDARQCPQCGGLPQLSIRAVGDDPLTRGQRQLMCASCETCWNYSASSCPSCGEMSGSQRTFYSDADDSQAALRVEACASCKKYLIDVDLARDPRAVPEVDELTALPLDLFASEQGLSKITPNLMGF
jgi:formate dehydrogenase maturation protein FdhE